MLIRKLSALLVACLVTLSLASCGGSSSSSTSSSDKEDTQEARTIDESEASEEKEQASASDVAVTIDNATLGQDYDGQPVVIVTYTFTNVSSDEPKSFMVSCVADVYQNGVECELAFVTDLEGDSSAKVKKGSSNTLQQAYLIQDRSDVEVEVKELFSWDDVVLASATFSFE